MRTTWNFFSAGQLVFGRGAVAQLGPLAGRHGWHRVLLVTDATLVEAGLARRATEPLDAAGIEVELFAGGEPEPSIAVARRAAEAAAAFRPDAILGLGGGSNMDLAKLTAALHSHGGEPPDYFGFDRIPGPVTPLVCVPTTSGTGSEVSHAAVLTDPENEIKVSTLSNWLRPALAVVDPALTDGCPPKVTADSGIDALTHAIEAYTATDYQHLHVPEGETPAYEGRYAVTGALAEQAIERIGRFLARAVHHGDDTQARDEMALAATLAGMAFSNSGVALVHAMEYPLGGAVHCSHGAGNGLLLPYVMRFNLAARTAEFAAIARLLGVDVDRLDEQEAAEAAIEAVTELRRKIGIPDRIRELGGRESQLPVFAEKAYAIKRLMWVNPRLPSAEDLLEIYRAAY